MTLLVTEPITVTPDSITACDVPENDYSAWASGSTYAVTDRVIKNHQVWESAQDGNVGKDPETERAWWNRVGPTNRLKAFDVMSYTTTTRQASGFFYEIAPSRPVDAVHAMGFTDVSQMRITITAADSTVLFDSGPIAVGRVTPVASFWSWFFGSRAPVRQRTFDQLPEVAGTTVRIQFWGGADCAVGVIVLGNRQVVAEPLHGVRIGIDDYSRKERDPWGEVKLEKRAYSKRITATLSLENRDLDRVERYLSNRRATPLVWSVSDRWQATEMLGFYRSWEILIAYYNYSEVSLEIEGMTEK